ncbi:Uncharacterized protein OBRU01_22700 [Operophtera brumata]|uniref:PHD-type domain-containing protein n=1 Tax=Operophtera brumata TaxID=104452 RepID=A0A0L7KSZ5_OPEBR|nr:Uncharacterized protein OBRU01_22700 [Operophtera brumata]
MVTFTCGYKNLLAMDCAFCNRTMEGCASIKCSLCSSQFHLECVSSETLAPNTNDWRCCRCRCLHVADANKQALETAIHA